MISLHVGVVNPIIISWFGRGRGKLRVSYSTDSSVIFYLNLRITENDGAHFLALFSRITPKILIKNTDSAASREETLPFWWG